MKIKEAKSSRSQLQGLLVVWDEMRFVDSVSEKNQKCIMK